MTEYGVFLIAPDGRAVFESASAPTPRRAVYLAEALHPDHRAYALTMRFQIIGRCRSCRDPILQNDRHSRYGSTFVCEDCG